MILYIYIVMKIPVIGVFRLSDPCRLLRMPGSTMIQPSLHGRCMTRHRLRSWDVAQPKKGIDLNNHGV